MRRKLALAGAWITVLGLLVSGCGGGHRGVRQVSITERDFKIRVPHVLPSGDVRLVVQNKGPVSHELVLVRASPDRLPRRADGFTIDEDKLQKRQIAVIEPRGPGTQTSVLVHLAAGRYILFCNMSGHAAGGMLTSFRVR